jgi:hypothetical protein
MPMTATVVVLILHVYHTPLGYEKPLER